MSRRIVGFNLEVAEGGGVGGDASSSSSSSVPSTSSSSFAAGAQPLSLGLMGPSSSTQSPSSPWRSVPGAEPSTPSSPATNQSSAGLVDWINRNVKRKGYSINMPQNNSVATSLLNACTTNILSIFVSCYLYNRSSYVALAISRYLIDPSANFLLHLQHKTLENTRVYRYEAKNAPRQYNLA